MAKAIPPDRLFSEEHEWIRLNEQDVVMGITDHAQDCLGDVVYVELPDIGTRLKKGAAIGVVESVKAVSDIYAPISGIVKAVNRLVIDNPELINQDPYGQGWMLSIEMADGKEMAALLKPEQYQDLLTREAK